MALVGVALVAALSAALLVVSGVGPGAAEAQTAQTSGTVVAWGDNSYGQTNVPPNLTDVEAISAGWFHSLALVVDTQDTTAPTIQAALDPASPGGQNGWYTGDVDVSWTVTDDESDISGQTGCDTQTVAADTAGITFTCSATSGGGTSSESVTVKRDATGPNVDPVSRTPAANSNGWNNTDVTVDWSCSDATSGAVDPGVSRTFSTEGQNQSAVGTCTDYAGNTASDTQTGINIDKTAPVLNPTVSPDPLFLNGTATAAANATDALSGIASQSCDAVDTSSVGYGTVACTATDLAGNTATANVAYRVVYDFAGFSQPVDNLDTNGNPVLNVVKAGQTIPLKWRLTDATSAPVTTLGGAQVGVVGISCSSDTTLDQLEEVAAGSSGLQNLGDGYYRLNWKSPSSYTGSCKRLRLNLSEGSAASPVYRTADFKFTK